MNSKLKELDFGLNSLVIFRGILKEPVIDALSNFLASESEDTLTQIRLYSKFVYELYKKSENLSKYMLTITLEDENSYIIRHAEGEPVDALIEECAAKELETAYRRLAGKDPERISEPFSGGCFILRINEGLCAGGYRISVSDDSIVVEGGDEKANASAMEKFFSENL